MTTPTKPSKERVIKSPLLRYQAGYIDGDVPCEVCQRIDNYPYWRTFTQISFMRGDDEVNGNLCKDCYKELRKNGSKKKQTKTDKKKAEIVKELNKGAMSPQEWRRIQEEAIILKESKDLFTGNTTPPKPSKERVKKKTKHERIGDIVKDAIESQMDWDSYYEGDWEETTEKIMEVFYED